ncbi:hypothetical protein RB195_004649 [Necator americanus]|uniref:Uncharacterized protein n=1 Tax=Necator americanus TaxID=51031 RepID=A0ABR1BJ02_NECAM
MFNELDEEGILLLINRKQIRYVKNAYWKDGGVLLEGSQIVETSSSVYLERPMNMESNTEEELNTRTRVVFAPLKEVTDQLTEQELRPICSKRQYFQRSVTQRKK